MSEELLLAIRKKDSPDDIAFLLDYESADINYQDSEGYTPLMEATLVRSIPILKLLLIRGADIHLLDHSGKSVLNHVYSEEGIAEHLLLPIINLLLEYQANYKNADDDGDTILKCASINGHIAIVGRLLRLTDIDAADALVFALEGGHQTMIDYLNVYLDEQNHLELDSFGSANSVF